MALSLNEGGGTFRLAETFPSLEGGVPRWLLTADLNGDGKPDLVLPKSNNMVSVLINRNSRDEDGDKVPDECELVPFHRGDPDGDGRLTITDAIVVLLFLFAGGSAPQCRETADVDNDGAIVITDPVGLLNYLFRGGPPPAAPGPESSPCGPDPDPPGSRGALGCRAYEHCR